MRLLDICAVLVAIAAVMVIVAGSIGATSTGGESANFTRELRLDTIGTKGFEIRRTIPGREVGSPDPILVARESLIAQRDLCPGKFDVQEMRISNFPPRLVYEAKIRCL